MALKFDFDNIDLLEESASENNNIELMILCKIWRDIRILLEQSENLSEKDLHCLARILQGFRYKDDMFACCRYCLYQTECSEKAKGGGTYFTETVAGKLQKVSGVYLGINTHNLVSKLLINSFQATNRPGNEQ